MDNLTVKLREIRKAKNWSQEDLARVVGVSLSTIQRWEAGKGKPIRIARKSIEKLMRKNDISSNS